MRGALAKLRSVAAVDEPEPELVDPHVHGPWRQKLNGACACVSCSRMLREAQEASYEAPWTLQARHKHLRDTQLVRAQTRRYSNHDPPARFASVRSPSPITGPARYVSPLARNHTASTTPSPSPPPPPSSVAAMTTIKADEKALASHDRTAPLVGVHTSFAPPRTDSPDAPLSASLQVEVEHDTFAADLEAEAARASARAAARAKGRQGGAREMMRQLEEAAPRTPSISAPTSAPMSNPDPPTISSRSTSDSLHPSPTSRDSHPASKDMRRSVSVDRSRKHTSTNGLHTLGASTRGRPSVSVSVAAPPRHVSQTNNEDHRPTASFDPTLAVATPAAPPPTSVPVVTSSATKARRTSSSSTSRLTPPSSTSGHSRSHSTPRPQPRSVRSSSTSTASTVKTRPIPSRRTSSPVTESEPRHGLLGNIKRVSLSLRNHAKASN